MKTTLPPDTAPRFDPRLIEVATRQAHALHRQAIDDALRGLGRWLSRPFVQQHQPIAQEQPCHS